MSPCFISLALGSHFERQKFPDRLLVSTEFSQALDAFRDRHDAHFILPVRQTIRQLTSNMRIYWYTGPTDPERGRPTRGVLYAESEVAERVYEQMLGETDQDIRDKISQELGDFLYDNYYSITGGERQSHHLGQPRCGGVLRIRRSDRRVLQPRECQGCQAVKTTTK